MSYHSVTRTAHYLNIFFLLIRQRTVGSVVTQSHDNDDSDVDEDEPNNEVFGVATVIKLAKDHVIFNFILLSLVPRRDPYILVQFFSRVFEISCTFYAIFHYYLLV